MQDMTSPVRCFITGCAGLKLTDEERDFIQRFNPWGLILFKRNVDDAAQLIQLTREFREIVGREDAPVLIDQEGGRVQRMGPPHWRKFPPANTFGRHPSPLDERADLVRNGARLIAEDLRACGINVDCLPVLDVPAPGGHNVIGDRAYGDDPLTIATLGRAACEGLIAGKVLPVVKHMPGHGRAEADSHMELPVVRATRKELELDFEPFRMLKDMPLAMSAHVVYTAIDPEQPATTSAKVVDQIMRKAIGFDGLIMSDDLHMKALRGSFRAKTEALFAAGLDMALDCHFNPVTAREVAEASPVLDGIRAERAAKALRLLHGAPKPFDVTTAEQKVFSLLA
jgi:beta-N-acetylhexosaminidase